MKYEYTIYVQYPELTGRQYLLDDGISQTGPGSKNRRGKRVRLREYIVDHSYKFQHKSFNNNNEEITGRSYNRSLVNERCWKE